MKKLFLVVIAVLVCSATESLAGSLTVTRPIQGGRWGSQSPSAHPKYVANTQYAVDVLVPMNQGTVHPVRWSTYTMAGYDDGFKATVVDVFPTCSANGAGTTVILRIYNAQDAWVGEMAYSHLDNVQVSKWQTFNWYATPLLGYTKRWPSSSCYFVNDDNAVHVHMEWGARSPYASSTYGYNAYQTIDFGMGAISK